MKSTIHWVSAAHAAEAEGYDRIGIMGTSLGSCLSMLTMAHEPRIHAGAFNHVSPYFADVYLQETNQVTKEGYDLYNYKLQFKYKGL